MTLRKDQAVAVLVSGGVESAAMLAEAIRRSERVYPLYVRKGLVWEPAELGSLRKLLRHFQTDGLAPLAILDLPVQGIYGRHWSLGKAAAPGFRAPDTAVYLPGRNLLLLSLAGLFCSIRKIPVVWIGVLKGNPFRDARPGVIKQMEHFLGNTLGFRIRIKAPFRELRKGQVIRRWADLPWERTFSCLRPKKGRHCGRCQKCAERKAGFRAAGVADPTRYA